MDITVNYTLNACDIQLNILSLVFTVVYLMYLTEYCRTLIYFTALFK